MQREKQVQIPELLWTQLMAYVLVPELRDKLDPEVRKGIEAKLDRQIAHDLYSKYRTAPSAEQKEKARREYLEKKGIPCR